MVKFLAMVIVGLLFGCSESPELERPVAEPIPAAPGTDIPMAHAETFRVVDHGDYRVVYLSAPQVSWGGEAQGPNQTANIVLVPKGNPHPNLNGELRDAVLVETPVQRIAVNYGFLEAIVTALDIEDHLVAVGGTKSYSDSIRARALSGEIAKVGYGWHSPPELDPLLNSDPDVFLMVMGSLDHTAHFDRIKSLGIPVVPIFFEAETSYMGPVDYVRLVAMLSGQEEKAEAFVDLVADNVKATLDRVKSLPKKRVLSSWYAGSDRWMVTVRNADNALLTDAGGINPLAQPDDIRLDDFVRLGTEVLLENAVDIDCWIARDSHSQPMEDTSFLNHFRAWREGCMFASDGMQKPEFDAFDIYGTGVIRPDIVLSDLTKMLHPELRDGTFSYIRPDTLTGKN